MNVCVSKNADSMATNTQFFIVNVIIIVNLVERVIAFLFPAETKVTFPALTATIKPSRFYRVLLHSIVFYPVIALY